MKRLAVVVVGTRTKRRDEDVRRDLARIERRSERTRPLLIVGDQTGIDAKAFEEASRYGWKTRKHMVNPAYGAQALRLRTDAVLAHAAELKRRPGWSVIFLAYPTGGPGTRTAVALAKRLGLEPIER